MGWTQLEVVTKKCQNTKQKIEQLNNQETRRSKYKRAKKKAKTFEETAKPVPTSWFTAVSTFPAWNTFLRRIFVNDYSGKIKRKLPFSEHGPEPAQPATEFRFLLFCGFQPFCWQSSGRSFFSLTFSTNQYLANAVHIHSLSRSLSKLILRQKNLLQILKIYF